MEGAHEIPRTWTLIWTNISVNSPHIECLYSRCCARNSKYQHSQTQHLTQNQGGNTYSWTCINQIFTMLFWVREMILFSMAIIYWVSWALGVYRPHMGIFGISLSVTFFINKRIVMFWSSGNLQLFLQYSSWNLLMIQCLCFMQYFLFIILPRKINSSFSFHLFFSCLPLKWNESEVMRKEKR